MSEYNTITSLAESPVKEGVIYAGTDDGIIQVTEDGGTNWKKIDVKNLPDVPETAFINDIKADLYDENTVYVALDNHKFGDLNPYLFKSTNRGKTWKSMKSNLPDRILVWRIVQDHVKPELMFLATEFGVYFTIDAGGAWYKLKGGVPTISFRDLAIQKRENDLVGASFGRGFFVLDDYSFLRDCSSEILKGEATLFNARKAWWYIQRGVIGFGEGKGSMGADYYTAPNPPYGATFTYYLSQDQKTNKEKRKEQEKLLTKDNKDIPFPGWDKLEIERRMQDPKIWITVKDQEGNVVRKVTGPSKKGFHRISWDLRHASKNVVKIEVPKDLGDNFVPSGALVTPGTYTATLSSQIDEELTQLSKPIEFKVEKLYEGALKGLPNDISATFWNELEELSGEIMTISLELQNSIKKVKAMQRALDLANSAPGDLDKNVLKLLNKLYGLDDQLNGSRSKQEIGETTNTTIKQRLMVAALGTAYSTYGPTPLHKESFEIAKSQHKGINEKLLKITIEDIPKLKAELDKAGAPNIEGFIKD